VLLDAGQRVIATDRAFDPALASQWNTQGVELIESAVEDLPSLNVDALIHAAAITAGPQDYQQTPEQNFRANIEPMLAMMEWGEHNQVRRSLFISSSAIYRKPPFNRLIDETTPAAPLGLYAVAKQTMEALAETLRESYGRDIAVMRLSNIYGPLEQPRPTRPNISLVGKMLHEALATGIVSVPEAAESRDWTFAPDVGRAALSLLKAPKLTHALYNVASEQIYTPLEIAHAIQKCLPHVKIENREATSLETSVRGSLLNERLRHDVGFSEWTPLVEGLKHTITAFKAQAERVS